ncbi:MAG: hypothetical protein GY828_06105 [Candidatus Gracilibacteria bacterium]|nr:hypothetical protein [Candidatus Gracilibacteria bacterium]
MKCIKRSLKLVHSMDVWDIGMYKLYILSFTMLFAQIFPRFLLADILVYGVAFVILYAMTMIRIVDKQGDIVKKVLKKGMKTSIFNKLDLLDITLFKVTVFMSGLLLLKFFHVLFVVYSGIYLFVFGLGFGYLLNAYRKIK